MINLNILMFKGLFAGWMQALGRRVQQADGITQMKAQELGIAYSTLRELQAVQLGIVRV